MSFFERDKAFNLTKKLPEKETEPDWLQDLEKMRSQRKQQASSMRSEASHTPATAVSKPFHKKSLLPEANATITQKVNEYFWKQWQEEHNRRLGEDAPMQVFLSNRWSVKMADGLIKGKDRLEESTTVVWLDESGKVEARPEKETNEEMLSDVSNPGAVQVTLVKPTNWDVDKKVCIVDEIALLESLKQQLKPHLKELLESSIKNMLLSNYDILLSCIQRELSSQLPQLLDELLENHIKELLRHPYKRY
ncbi:MAG: hypothetical protein WDW20_04415 [Neisseriaceae bacterium]